MTSKEVGFFPFNCLMSHDILPWILTFCAFSPVAQTSPCEQLSLPKPSETILWKNQIQNLQCKLTGSERVKRIQDVRFLFHISFTNHAVLQLKTWHHNIVTSDLMFSKLTVKYLHSSHHIPSILTITYTYTLKSALITSTDDKEQ